MKIDNDSTTPQRLFLKDYKAPTFAIDDVQLEFDLHETKTLVRCTQKIRRLEKSPLVLNGTSLKLISIKLNSQELPPEKYTLDDETLTISETPETFNLEILVEVNPEANKSCSGLYLSRGIFATQCEAEGFRQITYFMDRPDVMTSYTVRITADQKKYPVLLSNGDLIEKKELGDGRHQALWKDPFKKPSYLFALVAGDLGVVSGNFTTSSGKNVKLEVYASHGKQSRCQHALESLKKAMKWDEERFGLEYDLGQYMIVSIDDFNMGAMENKGLNIFNSRLVLADPQSATDTDFDRIESVVGHEYFHNWTGNRVTCRNWFELSLKEGLTVFRDQEFSSDVNSRAVQRIKDVDSLRSRQFAEDAGPNSHPVRPESCLAVDNFYTATIYEKGSEVIRMMQTIVGQKGFRLGMDEYFHRHDGQAVTIMDFADAIATPNKADFEQFKLWYSQAGTPEVFVTESYDASAKTYTLTLRQSCAPDKLQSQKKDFHIPLLIGLIDSKGRDMKLVSQDIVFNSDEKAVLHFRKTEQNFVFIAVNEKPVLSLNREFSAPIRLHWKASDTDLLHLIKYDSDAFNRREACYKMILSELRRLIKDNQAQRPLSPRTEVIDALLAVLNDTSIDPQFKALMLQLPGPDILAQEESLLDAISFNHATLALTQVFVKTGGDKIYELYLQHHKKQTSGDRALKNRLLSLLVSSQYPQSVSLASAQYQQAQNMTDKIAALAILCETTTPEAQFALDDFFKTWKDDSVVFNKWLLVQSTAQMDSVFENCRKLSKTPPFSEDNPNNIYSLHARLTENFYALQTAKENPFVWLADEILRIDRQNPQVAARICGGFNFIKKYPQKNKEQALNEIRRVLNSKELSKNSRELLESCL